MIFAATSTGTGKSCTLNAMNDSFGVLAQAFAYTTAVSLLGLSGGFLLLWKRHIAENRSHLLISFSAGAILAAAFLDLLPEAFHEPSSSTESLFMAMLVGILFFFILEKLLLLHHHAHGHAEEMEHGVQRLKSARLLVMFGDSFHNFLDGIAIAIAFLVNPSVGIVTALAVVAHEIPQEIGDFSILLVSGMERSRVAWWNIWSALVSPVGTIVGFFFFRNHAWIGGLPLTFIAGAFCYIALADLFPTIQHERKVGQTLLNIGVLLTGAIMVWLVIRLLPA